MTPHYRSKKRWAHRSSPEISGLSAVHTSVLCHSLHSHVAQFHQTPSVALHSDSQAQISIKHQCRACSAPSVRALRTICSALAFSSPCKSTNPSMTRTSDQGSSPPAPSSAWHLCNSASQPGQARAWTPTDGMRSYRPAPAPSGALVTVSSAKDLCCGLVKPVSRLAVIVDFMKLNLTTKSREQPCSMRHSLGSTSEKSTVRSLPNTSSAVDDDERLHVNTVMSTPPPNTGNACCACKRSWAVPASRRFVSSTCTQYLRTCLVALTLTGRYNKTPQAVGVRDREQTHSYLVFLQPCRHVLVQYALGDVAGQQVRCREAQLGRQVVLEGRERSKAKSRHPSSMQEPGEQP